MKTRSEVLRILVAAVFMCALLTNASRVSAQSDECNVEDRYGDTRDCTWTEKLVDCNYDVFDSWEGCMGDADGNWLKRIACEATGVADTAACYAAAAINWAF